MWVDLSVKFLLGHHVVYRKSKFYVVKYLQGEFRDEAHYFVKLTSICERDDFHHESYASKYVSNKENKQTSSCF